MIILAPIQLLPFCVGKTDRVTKEKNAGPTSPMRKRTRSRNRVSASASSASLKSEEFVFQESLGHCRLALRYAKYALIAIAIIYAFLAAFRTVPDFDLGWQLATGRWVVEHHQIPSTDVFSYTAHGKPWIYPVLPGLAFYGLYLLGGYPALSWLTAIVSALTLFFLSRRGAIATATLAVLAVPVIAERCSPRADLFSILLFAAVLSILWQYHRTGQGRLWPLPLLLLLWVNLHWGFVAGLGLCGMYVLLEVAEFRSFERRAAAKLRLGKAWPCLLACGLVTLMNPWGTWFYRQVFAWSNDVAAGFAEKSLITEYAPLRINMSSLAGIVNWRDPDLSAIWSLLAIAAMAVAISLARRNWGAAFVLAGAMVVAAKMLRFRGMFACVLVVVGGSILADAIADFFDHRRKKKEASPPRAINVAAICLCVLLASIAGIRIYDLVSNRYYLNNPPSLFGTGLSWWFPERAMEFVERERLPANVFNGSLLGGFLLWRLPQYPDFIDSRGRPFSGEIMHTNAYLPMESPDSSVWGEEAARWSINFMIVPASRIAGLEFFPKLREFCESQTWRPVYLDEVSAVFLRRSPETQALVDRLSIDCKNTRFHPPTADISSRGGRADLFTFWTNAGVMLATLGRSQEALEALNKAQFIFPDSAAVHRVRGRLLAGMGKMREAELELGRSAELDPRNGPWEELATLLWQDGRYDEATVALHKGAELLLQPARLYLKLGEAEARLQRPQEALSALDQAAKFSAWVDSSTAIGAEFNAKIAEDRAGIWLSQGNVQRAVEFEEQAVHFTPHNAQRRMKLAALYQALGRTSDAQQALQQVGQ